MPLVTAAEFSRLASVSKVAISKAVNANPPRLIVTNGKLDTDNPVNAAYLATSHGVGGRARPETPRPTHGAPAQKPERKPRAKKATEPATDDDLTTDADKERVRSMIADLMGETADLDLKKKKVDIALKVVLEKNHAFKLAKSKGEVITRDEFRRTAEGWNAALGQNVMRVPRRVMSRLWAMAKAGDEMRDGELMLERELSKAVSRALEGVASKGAPAKGKSLAS